MEKVIDNPEKMAFFFRNISHEHKIIMVNGCFDLFHIGHLQLLKFAKQQGDLLLVAVNSDKSIERQKGKGRPIIDEMARLEMLTALQCVDFVIMFQEDTPGRLIDLFKPNVIVKEEEYRYKKIPEMDVIARNNTELVFFKRQRDITTSAIIQRIKNL